MKLSLILEKMEKCESIPDLYRLVYLTREHPEPGAFRVGYKIYQKISDLKGTIVKIAKVGHFYPLRPDLAKLWYKPEEGKNIDEILTLGKERSDSVKRVYIIKADSLDLAKIGKTQNVNSRISMLKGASPVSLSLVRIIKGYTSTECLLHKVFSNIRKHGEWFQYSGPLEEFVKATKDNQEIINLIDKYVNLPHNSEGRYP